MSSRTAAQTVGFVVLRSPLQPYQRHNIEVWEVSVAVNGQGGYLRLSDEIVVISPLRSLLFAGRRHFDIQGWRDKTV
jgi:hypothetical protein